MTADRANRGIPNGPQALAILQGGLAGAVAAVPVTPAPGRRRRKAAPKKGTRAGRSS